MNDLGLDGIEFVEFTSPKPADLEKLFTGFGFRKDADHASKKLSHFTQGQIHFLINQEPSSFAHSFQKHHGPSIPSMALRVKDAKKAFKLAVERGAKPASKVDHQYAGAGLPAIMGIGDSLIYFVDQYESPAFYENLGFTKKLPDSSTKGMGFLLIDHLTNNVPKGEMAYWTKFYKDIFGFEEVRYFDIRGVKTGLTSFALRSPCGKFCIPINEGTEDRSQINEYLREYKGSGIQHIAFLTDDMVSSISKLKQSGIATLSIDDDYYQEVFKRVPHVTEDHKKLQELNILIDGDEEGYLLQIFTKNVVGPIFIEIIQRKNHYSFGEGNFGALFRSIEKDQEARGVL